MAAWDKTIREWQHWEACSHRWGTCMPLSSLFQKLLQREHEEMVTDTSSSLVKSCQGHCFFSHPSVFPAVNAKWQIDVLVSSTGLLGKNLVCVDLLLEPRTPPILGPCWALAQFVSYCFGLVYIRDADWYIVPLYEMPRDVTKCRYLMTCEWDRAEDTLLYSGKGEKAGWTSYAQNSLQVDGVTDERVVYKKRVGWLKEADSRTDTCPLKHRMQSVTKGITPLKTKPNIRTTQEWEPH